MLDLDLSGYSFECGAVLPKQFFADRRKLGEPIERLMFAVLNDAIRCYQTNVGVRRPHAQCLLAETKEWLFSPPDDAPPGDTPFSRSLGRTLSGILHVVGIVMFDPLSALLHRWVVQFDRWAFISVANDLVVLMALISEASQ